MVFLRVLRILAGTVCGAIANRARILIPFDTVLESGLKRRVMALKSSHVSGADAFGSKGSGMLAPGSAHQT